MIARANLTNLLFARAALADGTVHHPERLHHALEPVPLLGERLSPGRGSVRIAVVSGNPICSRYSYIS
jgi:hypothetical protein